MPHVKTIDQISKSRDNATIVNSYIATWVVYCAFEQILTEFLPGPDSVKTVVLSARMMNESSEVSTKFKARAVVSST
jgi:hypothetical protein